MLISDWSSDVCSSDLVTQHRLFNPGVNFDGDVATCVVDVHAIHILEVDGITKEWVVGGRYTLKLERVDTRWLISERVLQVRFQQGDLSLVGRVLDRADRKSTRLNSSH